MNHSEFLVDFVVTGESGLTTAIGRCGDEPIQVGQIFDAVYRYKPRRYPDQLGDAPVREVENTAGLRVVCIHAYELSLPLLGQGMTGSLVVEGEGLDLVVPGSVLGHAELVPH